MRTEDEIKQYKHSWYLRNKERLSENFKRNYQKRKEGLSREDREKHAAYQREWRRKNPEKAKAKDLRRYWMRREYHKTRKKIHTMCLKLDVLRHYGVDGKAVCVSCSFNDMRALSIHHIDNTGYEHRKQLGRRSIYVWLRDNNYPPGYQTLCMNCQFIKKHQSNTQLNI